MAHKKNEKKRKEERMCVEHGPAVKELKECGPIIGENLRWRTHSFQSIGSHSYKKGQGCFPVPSLVSMWINYSHIIPWNTWASRTIDSAVFITSFVSWLLSGWSDFKLYMEMSITSFTTWKATQQWQCNSQQGMVATRDTTTARVILRSLKNSHTAMDTRVQRLTSSHQSVCIRITGICSVPHGRQDTCSYRPAWIGFCRSGAATWKETIQAGARQCGKM